MTGDTSHLVRVLKGRDYKDKNDESPKAQPKAEPSNGEAVEMPSEEDPPEADLPKVELPSSSKPVDVDKAELARQQAEAELHEKERQAAREARRKEREERARARAERAAVRDAKRRKNALIREKRLSKLDSALPKYLSPVSVSSTIQTRIDALIFTARSGREPDVRKLAEAYQAAGFGILDLSAFMADHFEEEARAWGKADPIEAWTGCQRADWLVWACSGASGWGYPGLWPAAMTCVRQAIAVASSQIPKEVSVFLVRIVKDLDVFLASWRHGAPDLDLIDDLRQSTKKLIKNILGRLHEKPDLAISLKAAEAVRALVSLDPVDRLQVEAVAMSAAVLASALPEHTVMPASWLPDDPERAKKWASEGRLKAEITSKLAFLAPLVRRQIPVPVAVS